MICKTCNTEVSVGGMFNADNFTLHSCSNVFKEHNALLKIVVQKYARHYDDCGELNIETNGCDCGLTDLLSRVDQGLAKKKS